MDRYKPYENILFEDRTLGDLLEEFYYSIANDVSTLKGINNPSDEQLRRLTDLEEILSLDPDERRSMIGLSGAQKDEILSTAHKTGDPLVDYWEYRLSKDLDIDMDLKEVPPRDQWDD